MEQKNTEQKKSLKHRLLEFYDKKYRLLLIIPFIMLFLALIQIGHQAYTTGEFIKKDVSLKGGVTVTIPFENNIDTQQIKKDVSSRFPRNDIAVRVLRGTGTVVGIIVEADINGNDNAQVQGLLAAIGSSLKIDLSKADYGIEIIGSSLGESFFRESLIALAVTFLFMGIVIFIYFRTWV